MLDLLAEKHVIKAMLTGMIDEVTDTVPLHLFQSTESQDAVKKLWGMKGNITINTVIKEHRFQQDYFYECYSYKFDNDELPYYVERLKIAYTKKLANEYIKKINKLVVGQCTLQELATLLQNGVHIEFMEKDSKLTILPEHYAGEHFAAIMERAKNPEVKKGIRFNNLPELDDTFYGLNGGDLILACAQSGHGKTALALNLTDDIAINQGYNLYYANAEMREEELSIRIASKRALIPTKEAMSGVFIEKSIDESLSLLSDQYDEIGKKGPVLSKMPVMTINTIRRGYKKLANSGRKPDIILIDYIGKMELDQNVQGLTEWQKLYALSEGCKSLAVELDVPIIALAQLNEDGAIEGAKKMKNACDGVLFFQPVDEKDEEYMTETQKRFANYKIIKYKVRRNDNSKPIFINFTKKYQRITEV